MPTPEHRIEFEAWWNGVRITATLDVWTDQVDLVAVPGVGCLEINLAVFEGLLEQAREMAHPVLPARPVT